MSTADQFRSSIEAAGLTPPAALYADGKQHYFGSIGGRGDASGWYVLYLDGVAFGMFGGCSSGESQKWCAKADDELSDAERQAMRGRIKEAQRMRAVEEVRRCSGRAI